MAIETKHLTIGESNWTTNTFTASTGIGLLKRLLKVGGEAFAVISEYQGEDTIPKAVSLLVTNLDNDDVVDLIKKLTSTVQKDGKDVNFDIEFAGNYGTLFKVLQFVIKENFGSFLEINATQSV